MILLLKQGNEDSHIICFFNLRWVNLELKKTNSPNDLVSVKPSEKEEE